MNLNDALKIAERTCQKHYPAKKALKAIDDGGKWVFLFGSAPVDKFDFEWTSRKEDYPKDIWELLDIQTGTDVSVIVSKNNGACEIAPVTDYMHLEIGESKSYIKLDGTANEQRQSE